MEKEPAFLWYYKDWKSDQKLRFLGPMLRGALLDLIHECYEADQFALKVDVGFLKFVTQLTDEQWANGGEQLLKEYFVPHPEVEGAITHKTMFKIWSERHEYRKSASEAGKKSGIVRRKVSRGKKKERTNGMRTECEGNVNGTRTEASTEHERNANSSSSIASSSSSSSSPSDSLKEENIKEDPPKKTNFNPPTINEVAAYCAERSNKVDAETFMDHYISKGWIIGKTKMKDWRAAVRNWEKGNISNGNGQKYNGQSKTTERPGGTPVAESWG